MSHRHWIRGLIARRFLACRSEAQAAMCMRSHNDRRSYAGVFCDDAVCECGNIV
jgi:hypothetical protein